MGEGKCLRTRQQRFSPDKPELATWLVPARLAVEDKKAQLEVARVCPHASHQLRRRLELPGAPAGGQQVCAWRPGPASLASSLPSCTRQAPRAALGVNVKPG